MFGLEGLGCQGLQFRSEGVGFAGFRVQVFGVWGLVLMVQGLTDPAARTLTATAPPSQYPLAPASGSSPLVPLIMEVGVGDGRGSPI